MPADNNAAQRYAVILSWLETAKRQGQSAIDACLNIFQSKLVLD
jgi:hypothetical protein